MPENRRTVVTSSQDVSHGEGFDYVKGSPHLRHRRLRSMVEDRLTELVRDTVMRTGSCHVLEIGAGHGTFTDTLLSAGATVTVTEVSRASADHLRRHYADDERVEVFHDVDGESVFSLDRHVDAVTCISLLHHIPDYVDFVRRLAAMTAEGGWFYSVQDPTWYPRRTLATRVLGRGAYFVWRLGQGEVRRGLATRWRRLRGQWSETEPSDLVEYHVVRQGVDEQLLRTELARSFAEVEVFTYWSTQSPLLQRVLSPLRLRSDFGLAATGRLAQR